MKKLKIEYLEILQAFLDQKKKKVIKDIILRNIINLFENEEEEKCYKQVRVSNFWSNSYIEYES